MIAMNPQNGLRVSAYRHAATARATDRELFELSKYLIAIAPLPDLKALDHSHWRTYSLTKL
jgi:ubiquitin-like domain-containing CTD phosphatase 1